MQPVPRQRVQLPRSSNAETIAAAQAVVDAVRDRRVVCLMLPYDLHTVTLGTRADPGTIVVLTSVCFFCVYMPQTSRGGGDAYANYGGYSSSSYQGTRAHGAAFDSGYESATSNGYSYAYPGDTRSSTGGSGTSARGLSDSAGVGTSASVSASGASTGSSFALELAMPVPVPTTSSSSPSTQASIPTGTGVMMRASQSPSDSGDILHKALVVQNGEMLHLLAQLSKSKSDAEAYQHEQSIAKDKAIDELKRFQNLPPRMFALIGLLGRAALKIDGKSPQEQDLVLYHQYESFCEMRLLVQKVNVLYVCVVYAESAPRSSHLSDLLTALVSGIRRDRATSVRGEG